MTEEKQYKSQMKIEGRKLAKENKESECYRLENVFHFFEG